MSCVDWIDEEVEKNRVFMSVIMKVSTRPPTPM